MGSDTRIIGSNFDCHWKYGEVVRSDNLAFWDGVQLFLLPKNTTAMVCVRFYE